MHFFAVSEANTEQDLKTKKILVTGAAGFVGFSLAKALASDPQNLVVGLDNFNDYYDVKLKIVSKPLKYNKIFI